MAGWGRKSVGDAAQEIADHLKLVEHVKALQDGQNILAESISKLRTEVSDLRSELKVHRAETRMDAMKTAQEVVGQVQGGLVDRMIDLSSKIAIAEERSQQGLRQIEAKIAAAPREG